GIEAIQACVDVDVRERAPQSQISYFAFVDPSGGSSDSMALAIGHREGNMLIEDCIREIEAPFDPQSAVEEFARMMKSYRVTRAAGDKYAAQWVVQSFARHSIKYEHTDLTRSQLYLELLPRLNAKTVRLLDDPRAITQIILLERRQGRSGRDSIDHPDGTHDDRANVIAGLCGIAVRKYAYDESLDWVLSPGGEDNWNHRAKMAYVASGGRLNSNFRFGRGW